MEKILLFVQEMKPSFFENKTMSYDTEDNYWLL